MSCTGQEKAFTTCGDSTDVIIMLHFSSFSKVYFPLQEHFSLSIGRGSQFSPESAIILTF